MVNGPYLYKHLLSFRPLKALQRFVSLFTIHPFTTNHTLVAGATMQSATCPSGRTQHSSNIYTQQASEQFGLKWTYQHGLKEDPAPALSHLVFVF